ncbi:hypothetical protein TgHK011_004374 [Trichoderma gracile]|nr:hypothetical protein TgHK011_004374 [Trichoderma gracile]
MLSRESSPRQQRGLVSPETHCTAQDPSSLLPPALGSCEQTKKIPSVGPEPWPLARPPPDFLRVWPQTVSSWPELAPGTAAQWLNAYHRRPGYRSSGSPPVLPATDHTPGWANPSPLALRNGERHRNACSHSVGGRNLKALLTICHHLAVAPHGAPSRGRWQKLGGFELASL